MSEPATAAQRRPCRMAYCPNDVSAPDDLCLDHRQPATAAPCPPCARGQHRDPCVCPCHKPTTTAASGTCDLELLSRITNPQRRQVLHDAGLIDMTLPFGTVLPHDCTEREREDDPA